MKIVIQKRFLLICSGIVYVISLHWLLSSFVSLDTSSRVRIVQVGISLDENGEETTIIIPKESQKTPRDLLTLKALNARLSREAERDSVESDTVDSEPRHSETDDGPNCSSLKRQVDTAASATRPPTTSNSSPTVTTPQEAVSTKSTDSTTGTAAAVTVAATRGRKSTRVTNKVHAANITVYIEMIEELNRFYGTSFYTKIEEVGMKECPLPGNSFCTFQHTSKEVDVVFRQVQAYLTVGGKPPYRYCNRQIVTVMNTETERPELMKPIDNADISISYHPASEITITEACSIVWNRPSYKTPDPSGRKGVALLMNNCEAKWRNDYIHELSKYIHIYSYGKCFHNTTAPPTIDNRRATYQDIVRKHRMLVTFENTIQKDYITEKLPLCYLSGIIPVYWGPPEIYQWAPGNHTFIDPQKFKGPKELAEYLKRVDEDDDLFRYHTTNFDYTQAEKTHKESCLTKPWHCRVCEIAQEIKIERGKKGVWPRTCLP